MPEILHQGYSPFMHGRHVGLFEALLTERELECHESVKWGELPKE
jgi:hypothetical protein